VKTPVRIRSIAIVSNPDKVRATEQLKPLRLWLSRHGVRVLAGHMIAHADAVLTLGGDGTILAVAPKAALAGVPVLGVNVGRLGFMTTVGLNEMYVALSDLLEGRLVVSERLMLDVTIPRIKGPHLALNDAVVRAGSTTRVIMVNAMIENEDLGCFAGDGLIVATPTGSTAYSLAAQGPIVHPEMEALVLTPICAHSFRQRPVVFPSQRVLTISPKDRKGIRELQLCLDGQRVYRLRKNDRVIVKRSKYKLKLLQKPDTSYFGVLKEKLLWGGM
jgi:NAD+ kinase